MTETGGLLHLKVYDNQIDEKFTLRDFLKKRITQLRNKPNWVASIESLAITHNIFLTSTYKPFIATSSVYLKNDNNRNNVWNNRIQIPLNFVGQFISDMFLSIDIDPIGEDKETPSYDDIKYRYCHFPGIRILKEVKLVLNGQQIDVYGPDDIIFYLNFNLSNGKKKSFYECIGHSTPVEVSYTNIDFDIEQKTQIVNGYQTWKTYQPRLKMLIPLHFWFNLSIEKSFPVLKRSGSCGLNDNIKTDYLEITVAPVDEIVQAGKYNSNTSSIDVIPLKNKPGNNIELYSNNIFVNEEICNFYLDYIDKYLINLHNRISLSLDSTDTNINLKNLTEMGLTEYLYFGLKPANNTGFDNWYKYTYVKSKKWYPSIVLVNTREQVTDPEVLEKNEKKELFYIDSRRYYYNEEIPPINSFSWTFNKIKFIDDLPAKLFNQYTSALNNEITYQGLDNGTYLICFSRRALESGTGHINFSRLESIYFDFKKNKEIPQEEKFQLVISANVIDFLIITPNSIKKMINAI